jgi:hypothetical protein
MRKKLSQTPYAKKMRKMRRDETPKQKEKRLAHRRKLMARYRKFQKNLEERGLQ